MKTGLLLLSVCILTTVCAFAQNEQKRPFERENHSERAPQSTFFSLRENENPEIRRGRTPIATLQSATATHRLDSMIVVGIGIFGVKIKEKNVFAYDDNGNMIMRAFYGWKNNEWIGWWKYEYAFDNNGNMIMEILYDWENNEWIKSGKSKFEFTFDDNRNMIMIISYWWGNNAWRESWKEVFTFDDNGNETMRISYRWGNNAWVESHKSEYTFDDNGNETMRISYNWVNNAWRESWKFESTFDDNGNRIMFISYHWENNEWVKSEKSEYTFDNNGNEIMWVSYHWENNEWVKSQKLESTFDDNGNSIMQVSYWWDWESNEWSEEFKIVLEFDLFVSINNIIIPFDFFDEFVSYNKPIRMRGYNWIENAWQEVGVWTFYYSKLSTNNIPTIPATSISIFPNPASYHFTVSGITKNTLVSISNLTGQIVLQQVVSPSESISVNHLPAGIYIVNVNGESQRLIVR